MFVIFNISVFFNFFKFIRKVAHWNCSTFPPFRIYSTHSILEILAMDVYIRKNGVKMLLHCSTSFVIICYYPRLNIASSEASKFANPCNNQLGIIDPPDCLSFIQPMNSPVVPVIKIISKD